MMITNGVSLNDIPRGKEITAASSRIIVQGRLRIKASIFIVQSYQIKNNCGEVFACTYLVTAIVSLNFGARAVKNLHGKSSLPQESLQAIFEYRA